MQLNWTEISVHFNTVQFSSVQSSPVQFSSVAVHTPLLAWQFHDGSAFIKLLECRQRLRHVNKMRFTLQYMNGFSCNLQHQSILLLQVTTSHHEYYCCISFRRTTLAECDRTTGKITADAFSNDEDLCADRGLLPTSSSTSQCFELTKVKPNPASTQP